MPASASASPFVLSGYSVVLSPGTIAGGGSTTVTATITDQGLLIPVQFVDLFVPAPLSVTSVTPPAGTHARAVIATCKRSGTPVHCVQITSLGLRPGHSLAVTMSVTAPAGCSTSSLTWGAAVRSDGLIQFLLQLFGLGNLPLDAAHSALGTTVSDSCSLQFATEPQNVMVGQPVTASAFDPSGAPVSVDVVDASGQIVTGSTAPVTVALQNGGVATLGGTATQTASGGVATFADLTVSAAGSGFALSATSPGLAGATSTPFGAQNQATACSGPSCTTTAGNTQGSAQVLATAPGGTSGTLTESVNVQGEGPLTCGSYVSADPNTYDFMTTNQALSKTITITITDPQGQLPPVGRVLATQQICFQASYDFIQQGGGLAPQGTLPDGSTVFTGLLPSCNDPNSGPCHDRASDALMTDPASPTGYDIVLVASIPAAPGDPRMN